MQSSRRFSIGPSSGPQGLHHCEIRRSTLGDIKSVFIASAARTAIGDFGGGLAKKSPAELGVAVTTAALERAGVAPTDVQHVFLSSEERRVGKECVSTCRYRCSPSPSQTK